MRGNEGAGGGGGGDDLEGGGWRLTVLFNRGEGGGRGRGEAVGERRLGGGAVGEGDAICFWRGSKRVAGGVVKGGICLDCVVFVLHRVGGVLTSGW